MGKGNELLPIGSVVQLEDSTALVMIAGYLPIAPSEPDRIWNYSGFKFPLGYTDNEDIYCFDQEQIQAVYAYGYRDIEYDIFMSRLEETIRNYAEDSADTAQNVPEQGETENSEGEN